MIYVTYPRKTAILLHLQGCCLYSAVFILFGPSYIETMVF